MSRSRRRRWCSSCLVAVCAGLLLSDAQLVLAQSERRETPAVCESLSSLALPNTRVTMAVPVAAGAFVAPAPPPMPVPQDFSRMPAFCRVAATTTPVTGSEIKIEVWLPATGWNGKFVGVGNGGFSGAIWYFAMAEPLQLGYAVAATNTGHDGGQADARFALQPEQLADFSWRAVNEMTVKAKAIILAHYGRGARYSYWIGCSTGGRQGVVEAQRFPADYDGISAGAPAYNMVPLLAFGAKIQGFITDRSLGLTAAQLNLIKAAAIEACDARDGVTDRVVDDPRTCAFDPGTLQCAGGNTTNCLTTQQVAAVRSLYEGVRNRAGVTLFPGPAPGGEPAWGFMRPGVFPIGANFFRQFVMRDSSWTPSSLDVDRDVARALAEDVAGLTVVEMDLSSYFARGGKLLLWHGWTDAIIPARSTIDYHQRMLASSGAGAPSGARLFMLPGVDHCSGGEGTFVVDVLGAIDAWVTSGQAPDRIVAQRPLQGGAPRTRPLCAYPQVARYRGQGSTDDEKNFECRAPGAR